MTSPSSLIPAGSVVFEDPELVKAVSSLLTGNDEKNILDELSDDVYDRASGWTQVSSQQISEWISQDEFENKQKFEHLALLMTGRRYIYCSVKVFPAPVSTASTSSSSSVRQDSGQVIIRIYFPIKAGSSSPSTGTKVREAWTGLRGMTVREWDWEGLGLAGQDGKQYDKNLVFENRDHRTLSYLYQNLPSPTLPTREDISKLPDLDSRRLVSRLVKIAKKCSPLPASSIRQIPNTMESNGKKDKGKGREMDRVDNEMEDVQITGSRQNELIDIDWDGCGLRGMKSRLYGYQLRSLIRMIMQERSSPRILDPRFSAAVSATGEEYKIDMETIEVRREIGWYDAPRGGILCEEMGTGKTIMSLALILATKDALPLPDASLERTGVLSIDALERLPFETYSKQRGILEGSHPEWKTYKYPSTIPTLAQLCVHRFLTIPTFSSMEYLNKSPEALDLMHPDALGTNATGWDELREARLKISSKHPRQALKKMTMSGSRHPFYHLMPGRDTDCRSTRRDGSRELQLGAKKFVSKATLLVVPVMLLNQWKGELTKHLDHGALDVVMVRETIPEVARIMEADLVLITDARLRQEGTLIRNGMSNGKLAAVLWKRIMIDEGHTTSAKTSDLMVIARGLSVSHHWAITGTPTKNLLGSPHAFEEANTAKSNSAAVPEAGPSSDANEFVPEEDDTRSEKWSGDALDDLKKLGTMFGQYLQAKPFVVAGTDFAVVVERPLKKAGGPDYGAVQRVERLMQGMMIRNRASDIEQEVPLPPAENAVVGLDLTPLAQMTYNVLQAMIAINMIESERQDQDYLLHTKNSSSLALAIVNLGLACNWYAAGDLLDVKHAREIAQEIIGSAKLAKYDNQDQGMLKDALDHLLKAESDPIWPEISKRISLPLRLSGLPDDILQAACNFPRDENEDEEAEPIRIVTAETVLAMRSNIAKSTGLGDEWLGPLTRFALQGRKRENRVVVPEVKTKEDKEVQNQLHQNPVKSRHTSGKAIKAAGDAVHQKVDKMNVEAGVVIDVDATVPAPSFKNSKKAPSTTTNGPVPEIVLPEDLKDQQIGFSSFSAKVDWIVHEIVENPEDVFVIFSIDIGVIAHITEALDLVQVPSCYCGMGTNKLAREEALYVFQTGGVRVCLMDLKIAARGLNLVQANRAVFAEPVWRKDIEAQAIKRVHRIGQRRSTRTSTLYIKGSQEEMMVQRRGQSLATSAVDDVSIKELIAHPKFIVTTPPAPTVIQAYLVKQLDRRPEIKLEAKEEEEDRDMDMDLDTEVNTGPALAEEATAAAGSSSSGVQIPSVPRIKEEEHDELASEHGVEEEREEEIEEEDVKPDVEQLEARERSVRLFGQPAREPTPAESLQQMEVDDDPFSMADSSRASASRDTAPSVSHGQDDDHNVPPPETVQDDATTTTALDTQRSASILSASSTRPANDLSLFEPSVMARLPSASAAPVVTTSVTGGMKRKDRMGHELYNPRKRVKVVGFGV